jgi:hypothetical protein
MFCDLLIPGSLDATRLHKNSECRPWSPQNVRLLQGHSRDGELIPAIHFVITWYSAAWTWRGFAGIESVDHGVPECTLPYLLQWHGRDRSDDQVLSSNYQMCKCCEDRLSSAERQTSITLDLCIPNCRESIAKRQNSNDLSVVKELGQIVCSSQCVARSWSLICHFLNDGRY